MMLKIVAAYEKAITQEPNWWWSLILSNITRAWFLPVKKSWAMAHFSWSRKWWVGWSACIWSLWVFNFRFRLWLLWHEFGTNAFRCRSGAGCFNVIKGSNFEIGTPPGSIWTWSWRNIWISKPYRDHPVARTWQLIDANRFFHHQILVVKRKEDRLRSFSAIGLIKFVNFPEFKLINAQKNGSVLGELPCRELNHESARYRPKTLIEKYKIFHRLPIGSAWSQRPAEFRLNLKQSEGIGCFLWCFKRNVWKCLKTLISDSYNFKPITNCYFEDLSCSMSFILSKS